MEKWITTLATEPNILFLIHKIGPFIWGDHTIDSVRNEAC